MSPKLAGCARRRVVGHRGTAAVEFVIVLPVLMVIVIGSTDLGRMLHCKNVLTNATRSGASYGATHRVTDYTYDDWAARVEACVWEEAANLPGFDSRQLDVMVTTVDEPNGSYSVQVESSYPFEMLFEWPGWPRRLILRHSVTMRSYR